MTQALKFPAEVRTKTSSGQEVEVRPDEHLAIDVNNLSHEMMRQPALFAYYATLASESYRTAKQVKFKIHCLREDLDAKYRNAPREKGEKPLTETALKIRINQHPKMRILFKRYVDESRKADILRGLKEAFAQRKDMLQSIGANNRKEMEVELRTYKRKLQKLKRP